MIPQSHAYIIASGDEAVREKTALDLAQSLVCDEGGEKPCGVCSQCRRAIGGSTPTLSSSTARRTTRQAPREVIGPDTRHVGGLGSAAAGGRRYIHPRGNLIPRRANAG